MGNSTKHVGLRPYRLMDESASAIREKTFAEHWQKQQDDGELLSVLLSTDNHPVSYSERDAQVAATIIQWLGTPVGQNFLNAVKEISDEKLKNN